LLEGTKRFNELHREMPGVTPRALTRQARALEPLLVGLNEWGKEWLSRRGIACRRPQPDDQETR